MQDEPRDPGALDEVPVALALVKRLEVVDLLRDLVAEDASLERDPQVGRQAEELVAEVK